MAKRIPIIIDVESESVKFATESTLKVDITPKNLRHDFDLKSK